MSYEWLFRNLVAAVLLPPLDGLLLIVMGLLVLSRYRVVGRVLIITGTTFLALLAMPVVGNLMLTSLEGEPVSDMALKESQAIVVLGGGRRLVAPEYGGEAVTSPSLVRLRYAAMLYRKTSLPILVTGGKPEGGEFSEAELMSKILKEEYHVPVRWVEKLANNTLENAQHSARLLNQAGIQRVLLVTHAFHMARALRIFEDAGLQALPAPVEFHREPLTIFDFIPSSYQESREALHEWIGLGWYSIRGKR